MRKSTRKTIAMVMALGMVAAAVPFAPVSFLKDASIVAGAANNVTVTEEVALLDALENAQAGDVIKLGKSGMYPAMELGGDYEINCDLTIDLNGHSWGDYFDPSVGEPVRLGFKIKSGCTLTIEDPRPLRRGRL